MKKEEFVKELISSADQNGGVITLVAVFGRCVHLVMPYSNRVYEIEIDTLDFSVRAINSLKRSGLFTLGEVIDAVANNALTQIRNLGKRTENEIKTKIMVFGYEQLTLAEKTQFFYNIIEKNSAK